MMEEKNTCKYICNYHDNCNYSKKCKHVYTDEEIDEMTDKLAINWSYVEMGECGTGKCAHLFRDKPACHSDIYSDSMHEMVESNNATIHDIMNTLNRIVKDKSQHCKGFDVAVQVLTKIIFSIDEDWGCREDGVHYEFDNCDYLREADAIIERTFGINPSISDIMSYVEQPMSDPDEPEDVYLCDGVSIPRETYDEFMNGSDNIDTAINKLKNKTN